MSANLGNMFLAKPEKKQSAEDSKALSELTLLKPFTLKGHTGYVSCVALSADGSLALSGSNDNTVRLWDLKTGQCLKVLSGHKNAVYSVALNADGSLALSGSYDKTLRLWDLKTGKYLQRLKGHTSYIYSVALSADGSLALSGSSDKTLRLWDLKTKQCLQTLKGHTSWVSSVALSADGRLALSGSSDCALHLWDLKTGQCLQTLAGHTDHVNSVALSADGSLALSGSFDKTLRLWDLKTGKCRQTLSGHTSIVKSVALSADGSLALSGSDDKTLRIWDLKTGQCEVLNYQAHIWSIATYVHSNQLYVLAGLIDGTLDFRHIRALPSVKPAMVVTASSAIAASSLQAQTPSEIEQLKERIKQLELAAAEPPIVAQKPKPARFEEVSGDKKDKKEGTDIHLSVSYKIDFNTLTIGKKLGQGTFGAVFQGSWRHNDVAVKQVLNKELSSDATKEFEAECQIMPRLRSPNIIQFYGYCPKPHYCLVMELMPLGSLYSVLHSDKQLDWTIRGRIATDIACGLAFLHKENILHRDVKSLNVLLNEQFKAKLTDFGLSKVKSESQSTSTASKGVIGTLAWMSPELAFGDEGCTKASDVYSMGITFWELAARQLPFKKVPKPALIPMRVHQGYRDDIPEDCPKKLATLIRACWAGEAQKRPEADMVVDYLKSDKDDFVAFLPGFLASRNASSLSSFNQDVVGNLNSNTNVASANNASSASSFNHSIVGNLASGNR